MFAEMTPGSNHSYSRKGIDQNCCVLCRQQTPRSEKICHFSGTRTKDQRYKNPKSPCLRNCLTFCFKDQTRMEQREPPLDPHVEGAEGRLRELASKWFVETQVPLIVQNGFFPTWFLGFITRKEAEEILREKELGCFLIRLSDKAIGYILSYKGRDRCRHFMINQSESGQFVVCGDTEGHNSVSDLIEYYRTSSIQPFGEYLTSSCFQALNKEVYDIIQVGPKENAVVGVGARNVQKPHVNSEQPPARPPKSSRTLELVPPLPRRGRHPDSSPLSDPDRVLYAHLRKQSPREVPRFQQISQDNFPGDNPRKARRATAQDQSRCSPPSGPESVYSEPELQDSKSRSLPLLDISCDGEQSYRLTAPPHTPPRLSPKPARRAAYSGPDSMNRPSGSHSLEHMSEAAVYHLAGMPGGQHTTVFGTRSSGQHSDSVYAEVQEEAVLGRGTHDNTYEWMPGEEDTASPEPNSNTYEPLEDIRPKHSHSSWGLKNDKWKWLFPEVKRKW